MTTVIAHSAGFVAGGDLDDGGPSSPAVWLSPDGVSWPSVVRLPKPRGVYSSSVQSLGHIGSTLVAVGGIARFDGDTESGWTSWTSIDGGRTWRAGTVSVPARASAATLISVPGGLVALGNAGLPNALDAAALFSRDGKAWRALSLPGDRVRGQATRVSRQRSCATESCSSRGSTPHPPAAGTTSSSWTCRHRQTSRGAVCSSTRPDQALTEVMVVICDHVAR
jgi:hypothetical protein